MSRALRIGLLAVVAVTGTGCAATWTSIHKNEDGSYTMTQEKNGFFRNYGRVFRCQPKPDQTLVCELIDEQ
jgi:hypothetical protein